MKGQILKAIVFSLLILSALNSCKKEDDRPLFEHFVSSELVVTYPVSTIGNMLDAGIEMYPSLAEIKTYLESDVNVYRFVYTTGIMGKEIEASGLVCVPATQGEYPVLSFQNGTNTVNDYAPSEYVVNPSYQLIEYIASMGFVVIIPDYPGFGESVNIPHPYLIAEPTVGSIVDMFYALSESCQYEFPGIVLKNEYYLLGYSQGGWATLNLHKAMELHYNDDFNLAGSVCGAGPYNILNLFRTMTGLVEYPVPAYLGYIVNAYSYYGQFTNSVCSVLNTPWCENLGTLFNGTLTIDEINGQMTTVIDDLFNSDFLNNFETSPDYSTVYDALEENSVSAWVTETPLLFVHGSGDTHVDVSATETMYDEMTGAGTSTEVCTKIIYPGLDHGDAVVPCMTDGLLFILELKNQ